MDKQISILDDGTVQIVTTNDPIVVTETHTPDEIQRRIDVLTLQMQEEMDKRQAEISQWQSVLDNQDVKTLIQQIKSTPVKVSDNSSTPVIQ